jgi:hypothetical protein
MTPDDGPGFAWLLWGRMLANPDDTKPLGCYASRNVALEAEQIAREHPNAPFWADFWVKPWPLATEPIINFRMEMRAHDNAR